MIQKWIDKERVNQTEGKVAMISGGARGMGAAEARLFAQEGAKVIIGDVLEEEGRQVEAETNDSGGQGVFLRLDVTTESDWSNAVAAAVSKYGRLDTLVNNVGIGGTPATVEETTSELWDTTTDINAKGVFLGTKAAIPEMRKVGGGSIINISSNWGLVGSPRATSYHVAKGAVRLLTKSTAIQYAGEGIRANSVHPSSIATPMTERLRINPDPESNQWWMDRTPLGQWGEPEELA